MKHMKIKNFQNFGKLHFPKLFRKAKIRIISFIVFVLVAILLIYLIKNGWDFNAAVQDMLSLFRVGKKQ